MAQHQGPATALVTGAARRLGRAIALDLAQRGWSVGVHYHASAAEALAVVEEREPVDDCGSCMVCYRNAIRELRLASDLAATRAEF